LLGSVVFPAVSTAITRSVDARAALRAELRGEIDEFTRTGAAALAKWAETGDRSDPEALATNLAYTTAGQRLALLLPRSVEDLNRMVAHAVGTANDGDLVSALAEFDACTDVLTRWYRGTISYGQVRSEFESQTRNITAKIATRVSESNIDAGVWAGYQPTPPQPPAASSG